MTYTVQYCVACARLLVSADERKQQVSCERVNEWETAGREKDRACKHLFKYMYMYLNPRTTPPTFWKTISHVNDMSRVTISKGTV